MSKAPCCASRPSMPGPGVRREVASSSWAISSSFASGATDATPPRCLKRGCGGEHGTSSPRVWRPEHPTCEWSPVASPSGTSPRVGLRRRVVGHSRSAGASSWHRHGRSTRSLCTSSPTCASSGTREPSGRSSSGTHRERPKRGGGSTTTPETCAQHWTRPGERLRGQPAAVRGGRRPLVPQGLNGPSWTPPGALRRHLMRAATERARGWLSQSSGDWDSRDGSAPRLV